VLTGIAASFVDAITFLIYVFDVVLFVTSGIYCNRLYCIVKGVIPSRFLANAVNKLDIM